MYILTHLKGSEIKQHMKYENAKKDIWIEFQFYLLVTLRCNMKNQFNTEMVFKYLTPIPYCF